MAFQLLIAGLLDLRLFFLAQLFPPRLVYLNDSQGLGMVENPHILNLLEGISQDIPLGLLAGIADFGKRC